MRCGEIGPVIPDGCAALELGFVRSEACLIKHEDLGSISFVVRVLSKRVGQQSAHTHTSPNVKTHHSNVNERYTHTDDQGFVKTIYSIFKGPSSESRGSYQPNSQHHDVSHLAEHNEETLPGICK